MQRNLKVELRYGETTDQTMAHIVANPEYLSASALIIYTPRSAAIHVNDLYR